MKRSPELAILSREHHIALELALRLKRAGTNDIGSLSADAGDFWHREVREHFRVEEELLLPALARHTGTEDPDIQRVAREHADLRQRFNTLAHHRPPQPTALNELGERLSAHIRFEERILFDRVETLLGPDELEALGRELRAAGGDHDPRASDQGVEKRDHLRG